MEWKKISKNFFFFFFFFFLGFAFYVLIEFIWNFSLIVEKNNRNQINFFVLYDSCFFSLEQNWIVYKIFDYIFVFFFIYVY